MRILMASLALVLASPAFGQSIEERRMACDAGDRVACAVLNAFENAVQETRSTDPPSSETEQVGAQTDTQGVSTVVPSTVEQIITPEQSGLVWWQKLLIACGVLYLLGSFSRGILRARKKTDERDIWSGDTLALPRVLPGERLAQGDLAEETDRNRQIVPWDTTHVMKWIDQQRLRIKSQVTDPDVKEFERLASEQQDIPEQLIARMTKKRHEMLHDHNGDESFLWTDVDSRYHQLIQAKYGYTGGAYLLANVAHYHNQGDLADEFKFSLWRLDADRDFNPAAVNMWGLVHETNAYAENFVDIPTCEAYLRHFFNLGAVDGHYHIATQLINFYVASPYIRRDEGYVAAAMDRIREIDKVSYNDWLRFMKRNKLEFDLEDKSISRNGLLYEIEVKKMGTIQ